MTISTWEYHLEQATALTEDRLNELGLQGWELAALDSDGDRAIFKRPGPDYRERITIAQREQIDASKKGLVDEA